MVKLQVDAKLACGHVHDAQAFWHDFFANAVSWDHGDTVSGHGVSFVKSMRWRQRMKAAREKWRAYKLLTDPGFTEVTRARPD
jgi:hypothetical protein